MTLTKSADPDKYGYSDNGIGFDAPSNYSINGEYGKNAIILSVDNSISVHADNRKQNILVIGEGPIDGLDDTTITAKALSLSPEGKSV